MIKMLWNLLTSMTFVVGAMAAPACHVADSHHLNCNFNLRVTELCKYSTGPILSTSAALDTIVSPWGNTVITNYTETARIDDKPLSIYARSPQESIVGSLSIERPNNTDVEFQWTYGPSGGRPVTDKWTEAKEGPDGRNACTTSKDWNHDEATCHEAQPTSEREKVLHCWFKCNAVADAES